MTDLQNDQFRESVGEGLPADVEAWIEREGLSAVLLAVETVCLERAAWENVIAGRETLNGRRWTKAGDMVGHTARNVPDV